MSKYAAVFNLILLGLIGLSACQPASTPAPTATARPVAIGTPIGANKTSVPTVDSAKPAQEVLLAEPIAEEGAYFSVRPPLDYKVEISTDEVLTVDPTEKILIRFFTAEDTNSDTPESIIDFLLEHMFVQAKFTYERIFAGSRVIDGFEALEYDYTGALNNDAVEGKVVIAIVDNRRFLIAIALAALDDDPNLWKDSASQVFEATLATLKVLDPNAPQVGACVLSEDDTYGYSKDNPIQIGGDAFEGPSRERDYLENLIGPNGEALTYERKGSLTYGETILDEYVISGLNEPITLYLDEYAFSEPQAPVGLACKGEFSLPVP